MRDKSLRSGERQVGPTLAHVEAWHSWRYEQTLLYVHGRFVLDIGCGVGYGTWIMSGGARECMGVDDSAEAIDYAKQHYAGDNISYFTRDFLEFESAPPDVLVAFEIIEHIKDTDAVFKKFKELNPEVIFASVPHLKCPISGNAFHHRHFGMDELIERFWAIGYRPERAELRYFGKGLCNFMVLRKG